MLNKQKKIVKLVIFIAAIVGCALCTLWCINIVTMLGQLYSAEYDAQIAAFGVYNEHTYILNQVAQMNLCYAQFGAALIFGIFCLVFVFIYIVDLFC